MRTTPILPPKEEDNSLVRGTTKASLAVQFVTGVALLSAFFLPLSGEGKGQEEVYAIIVVETASQVIELLYYAISVFCFGGRVSTWTRYIDWYISTPTMLFSLALFFSHRDSTFPGTDLLSILNSVLVPDTSIFIALNWLMLSFGVSVELGVLPRAVGLASGGMALTGSFSFLARSVNEDDVLSLVLLYSTFVVWFMYGFAAALSYVPRNVTYNVLDVVSKNFYGIFLTVYLFMM